VAGSTDPSAQTSPVIGQPLWLLAELTYQCPLHCVFCYNPTQHTQVKDELSTAQWVDVMTQARQLGAAQLGFSGGEPLLRDDLELIVAEAHRLGYYTNLLTSGVGLTEKRAAALKAGRRVQRTRYGVDDETCTGDHSCVRLSGCPTLTVKPSRDPLKTDPVASVDNGCVGCGLCGEVAQAAALCPSFWRADVITHPSGWERWRDRLRRRVISWMQA